jgi:hypothetical protein
MHLDLSDEETAALTQELHDIVESDRYPFSPRIRSEGDPRQAPTRAHPRVLAAAEGVCAAASRPSRKAPDWPVARIATRVRRNE